MLISLELIFHSFCRTGLEQCFSKLVSRNSGDSPYYGYLLLHQKTLKLETGREHSRVLTAWPHIPKCRLPQICCSRLLYGLPGLLPGLLKRIRCFQHQQLGNLPPWMDQSHSHTTCGTQLFQCILLSILFHRLEPAPACLTLTQHSDFRDPAYTKSS